MLIRINFFPESISKRRKLVLCVNIDTSYRIKFSNLSLKCLSYRMRLYLIRDKCVHSIKKHVGPSRIGIITGKVFCYKIIEYYGIFIE